jgi:hypothetical protein
MRSRLDGFGMPEEYVRTYYLSSMKLAPPGFSNVAAAPLRPHGKSYATYADRGPMEKSKQLDNVPILF